jgi:hypothetical protein
MAVTVTRINPAEEAAEEMRHKKNLKWRGIRWQRGVKCAARRQLYMWLCDRHPGQVELPIQASFSNL